MMGACTGGGTMMGGGSYGWMTGAAGYQWMMGGPPPRPGCAARPCPAS